MEKKTYDEFFIVANTFAAPIVSERIEKFVKAKTADEALLKFIKESKFPSGIYSAHCYENANDYHRGRNPISKWFSNHLIELNKITAPLPGYSYLGKGPGIFEIDGVEVVVEKPKEGKIVK